mgnify:CR=1 FL=1
MKFLLFDENAISTYVSESHLQILEYQDVLTIKKNLSGQLSSEIFHNTTIEYVKDGILFVGRKKNQSEKAAAQTAAGDDQALGQAEHTPSSAGVSAV